MQLDLSKKQVRCKNCSEIFFQTTDYYSPTQILAGEMLEWIPRYGEDGLNWSLPFASHDLGEAIICEGCGFPLAPTGILGLERLDFDAEGTNVPTGGDTPLKNENTELLLHLNPEETTEIPEDPLTKALTLKACPECGGFFTVDQWPDHLASHPPEVREKIEGKVEPVKEPEAPTPIKSKKKKPVPKELGCPICGEIFEKQWMFDDHMKSHDMSGIQKVAEG